MGVGVRAHEMSAAGRQTRSRGREAMVVFGHGFIEVGAKAESRLIGVRERGYSNPDAVGLDDRVSNPGNQPPAIPGLGIASDPFRNRDPAKSPASTRRPVIDQGRKRVGRLAAPEFVDVDQDMVTLEQGSDRAGRTILSVEKHEAARAKRIGVRVFDGLEWHAFLSQNQRQARRSLPQK